MSHRQLLLGAGWKMNKTGREAEEYTCRLAELLPPAMGMERPQIFVVPPFTAIEAVKRASGGRFWVGAQNMHWAESGAFTGEISAPMLRELGVDLVELGHAERRQYFNETDEAVHRKVHMALEYGIRPLLCVGEREEDKEYGVGRETVARQLRIAFRGVPAACASQLIVAYEPVWAIGEEGTAAPAGELRVMNGHIRSVLKDLFDSDGEAVPVLYGGTVNADNGVELLTEGQADGLFVGRAALDPHGFGDLIANCVAARAHSGTCRASEPSLPHARRIT